MSKTLDGLVFGLEPEEQTLVAGEQTLDAEQQTLDVSLSGERGKLLTKHPLAWPNSA